MSWKLLIVTIVALFAINYALGAPYDGETKSENVEDLSKKFVEFLSEDREFHGLLEQPRLIVNDILRNKRQAGGGGMDDGLDLDGIGGDDDQSKKPGFFDRATRFVMEVLQRFLRWINTDQ